MSKEQILVDIEPLSRRILFASEKSLYEFLINNNIRIKSLCGGLGTCGKCKLLIQKGIEYVSPPSEKEYNFIINNELDKGWRLACQTSLNINKFKEIKENEQIQLRIFLPEDLLLEDFKILTYGLNKEAEINPAIKKIYTIVEKPTLDKPLPDLERINNSMLNLTEKKSKFSFNFDLLNLLPKILRESDHRITLTIWDDEEIIACEPGETVENNFGIAFDIGTTTIVGYLINLNTGKIHSVASKLNPQTAFGEDVVTRMTFIKDNEDGLNKLNSVVINALNDLVLRTCNRARIQPSQIYEATVVGNTVMHHIFLGLDPINIGLSPYIPIVQHGLNVKSKNLNLNINNHGNVYTLPIIAGFVGADTMGVILSSHVDEEKDLTLIIDIGTNGEIILGNHKIIATGSCAAGSALEGAHIKDGMRAAAGAIDSIKIDPDDFSVSYTTIKNKKPVGLCGSGLIDTVAEMLKAKILTRSGSFNKDCIEHKRFIKHGKTSEFVIAYKDENNLNRDITISQNDIREIQMAKAAFYSGTRVILHNSNFKDEIKQVFLAGAFGNYINKENAKFIGMIPDISDEKIFQIGNAAGIGAQNCLINKELRNKAELLLKNIKYIEIATKKEFQKEYAEAMYFPHLNLKYFPSLKDYAEIPKR